MKGKFITFEGSEGCGKSTQSRLLCEYLKKKGRSVLYLREPGGTMISEKIREILLSPKSQMNPACETLLYMAARAQIVTELIKPALFKGKIVICDRFLDSTIAYQGYGLGVDIDFIKGVGWFASEGIQPGLTIFLDLPVKNGLKHRATSKDRIEKRSLVYHEKVRNGYLKLARQETGRIKIVRVDDNIEVTQANIRALIDRYVI
ncbi:MAG: dTMP kinase [Candidatus Omnitrophica bacterium]|nr:dTMP kinase [Candidatus Omnitrophota bacterium]